MLQAKTLAQFVDLLGHGRGVSRVTRIHLEGNGAALGIGHHPIDNAGFTALLIPVVAEASQRAGVSFVIAAGDVVKDVIAG